MASGFFALFDDIAVLMDDVASMSKIATKKTGGLLADDLAVNAEKASGFVSAREIPVLWQITKGSFLNKLIILPAAFLLSAFLPGVIVPILFVGGLYLAYEGAEKIYEYLFHRKPKGTVKTKVDMTKEEILALEKDKIKSAILIDFILSVEIIIIALSSVADQPLKIQIPVVTVVAIIATIGVYGLVALLVRMDDFGLKLINLNDRDDSFSDKVGRALVNVLPYIIRGLGVLGTIAMILVAGGIFVHNIEYIHHLVEFLPGILGEFLVGLIVGASAVLVMKIIAKLRGK
jgi:predicted DNA repair protein MutK